MSGLSVQIIGLEDFMSDVKRSTRDAKPLLSAALFNSATKIQSNARSQASHKTGALQRSVLTQVSYPSAKVSVEEKYGEYVEQGTKPHTIVPKNKKALWWNGAFSPVKAVYHPGTKAKPFFRSGVDMTSNYIDAQFTKVAENLIHIMAGH